MTTTKMTSLPPILPPLAPAATTARESHGGAERRRELLSEILELDSFGYAKMIRLQGRLAHRTRALDQRIVSLSTLGKGDDVADRPSAQHDGD